MPRVTVLMPVHNHAGFLATSLGSVLGQTLRDLEVIVAGDGCTDDSAGVVARCDDPRVRWVGLPKGPGLGYANRQRALADARGELVAYLEPDDLWAPHHLETLAAVLDHQRLDYVFTPHITAKPGGLLCPHYFPFDIAAGLRQAPLLPRLLFLCSTQVVHTRSILDRAGGWDDREPRFGDVALWLRFRVAGGRGRFWPEATVLRMPSLYFRNVGRQEWERLHSELGAAVLEGRLDLGELRWPLPRRVAGGAREFVAVGRAKGLAYLRSSVILGRLRKGGSR